MGGMAISMAAMMAPTAAPFFVAFGRDTKRPVAVATTVVVYVAVWALIGAGAGWLMSQVMLPSSALIAVLAVGLAALYMLMPWSRWAQARCQAMCRREARGSGVRDTLVEAVIYTGCCIVCSAGVMGAVLIVGMSNVLVLISAAAALLVYKLI